MQIAHYPEFAHAYMVAAAPSRSPFAKLFARLADITSNPFHR